MNHHFAASWLQSLSAKLDSLQEWSYLHDQAGGTQTHRNLFKEFFSTPFQKTLALVEEQKKTAFLSKVEGNLHKFDEQSQQFPLGCLCAVLQHGKESPRTHEKIEVWVSFLLDKLWRVNVNGQRLLDEVLNELMSPEFQRFTPLMSEQLEERLADGLGEHLSKVSEDMQKRVLEVVSAVHNRIERLIVGLTESLSSWVDGAPRFPATPLQLHGMLKKMGHPLIRFFIALKDPSKKENFLVAVALSLNALQTRYRWMCTIEPDLDILSQQLKARFFTVEGKGPVMDMWLGKLLKKYNMEALQRGIDLLAGSLGQREVLKQKLHASLPPTEGQNPENLWISLQAPCAVEAAIIDWLVEQSPKGGPNGGFSCPRHTLAPDTMAKLLLQLPNVVHVDQAGMRVRLVPNSQPGGMLGNPGRPAFVVAPPVRPPVPGFGRGLGPSAAAALGISHSQGQVVSPLPSGTAPTTSTALAIPSNVEPLPEADNLIDLLLNEALQSTKAEFKDAVGKISRGCYKFGESEVTLHTQNGRLFVYRAGDQIKNAPIQEFLSDLGVLAASIEGGGAVDTSALARIVNQSAQISAGVTSTTAALRAQTGPYGAGRAPEPPKIQATDPQVLMNRRVEAAHKAMDVNKQILRRQINFDDDKFLKKLVAKGLKHDKSWQDAYKEYCIAKGVGENADPRVQSKEFISTFVERNMANSINQAWAQKIMYKGQEEANAAKEKKDKKEKKEKKAQAVPSGPTSLQAAFPQQKKEKKDKKDKKDKKEKKGKRKASSSSSSCEEVAAKRVAQRPVRPL